MRHDGNFSFGNALPDAPLPMPKQRLEAKRRSLFDALRGVFLVFAPR
ncbi:MAG: hypothetical protein JWP99_990 [Devosia sp.]|nr:hypothetical protein [Devosia sp.]